MILDNMVKYMDLGWHCRVYVPDLYMHALQMVSGPIC